MNKKFSTLLFTLTFAVMIGGCGSPPADTAPVSENGSSKISMDKLESGDNPDKPTGTSMGQPAQPAAFQGAIPLSNDYIAQVADDILKTIVAESMGDYEKINAVYKYVITNTYFADPVGLDIWRYRGNPEQVPAFVENRALSPMLYGIGSCEDYAAATAVLLMRLGYEAEYVPGLTISIDGNFVDHAWTVVKIGAKWYHLDTQLEDNIIRNDTLRYRYFLKDDKTMLADHRWGDNLADYYGVTAPEELAYIKSITPPACEGIRAAMPDEKIVQVPRPDRLAVLAQIKNEIERYEMQNGPLEEITLRTTPPKLRLN